MINNEPKSSLRQRAEEIAHEKEAKSPDNIEALSSEEIRRMVHELRVHQIELEIQNEQLRQLSISDITERKQAEASLLEAEWKFKALFEKSPIGVAYHAMIYDNSGQPIDCRFLDVNETYKELTGVDPRGKTVRQAFPGIENDPFDWIGTYGHVARTGESIRFEQYFTVNGRWYDCVGYQYKPDHFVAAFIEITKRKRAQEALAEQLDFNQRVFNSMDAHLAVVDVDGTIVEINAAWRCFAKQNEGMNESAWGVGASYFVPYDKEWGDTTMASEAFDCAATIRIHQ